LIILSSSSKKFPHT